ncbi:MAG: 2-oxoisovalerate dehydrogenase E1 subunit beta [Caldimonas sp.]
MDTEILFNVEESDEGGYIAASFPEGIVTQADSIEELHRNVRDAVTCHFGEAPKPRLIRLHFVRDEVLTT